VKVILNTVLALLFGSAGPLAETFVQNNVQTAAVLEGLKNGSNAVATYTASLTHIAAVIFVIIAICFAIRAADLVVRYIKDKIDEDKDN
jgi:hypothetical protein